ncbi:unnamed protein product, partial [Mesorhabditis belari]|uniref:Proteasomal ubiquitin receptor ADRM1 homolog n=1 Tax=Mesorhabditis belari TaxID=2138241 RepID=A0AAF3E8P4_9BILA
MSGAMFANARAVQGGSTNGFLLEIKAGRSNLVTGATAEKKKVVADKTKGLLFIKQSNDQLMHFCWKNRETGAIPDDLIIFPGDTEFLKVSECMDGKVYMLKFKTTSERRLFWIQDGNPDADKDLCQKINDLLNKPPVGRATTRGVSETRNPAFGGPAGITALHPGAEDLGAFGGLDQNQLMQLLALMNQTNGGDQPLLSGLPSSAASLLGQPEASTDNTLAAFNSSSQTANANTLANSSSGASKKGAVSAAEYSQLQSLLAGIKIPRSSKNCDLTDVLKGEKVLDVVRRNHGNFTDKVINVEEVPESSTTVTAEVEGTIRQPQFQQAVGMFGYALNSGQLGPVLQQFGMSEEVVRQASDGDALGFAESLTNAERSRAKEEPKEGGMVEVKVEEGGPIEEPREPEPKRGKPDDEPDNMDLD